MNKLFCDIDSTINNHWERIRRFTSNGTFDKLKAFSREEIIKRIESQMSNNDREKHADIVIDNDGTIEQLEETVKTLWQSRVNGRVT